MDSLSDNKALLNNTIRVVCGILKKDQYYFVAQRPLGKSNGGQWEFPGGKIEEGETPFQAIMRELKEEAHIIATPIRVLPSVIHSYKDKTIELIPIVCNYQNEQFELTEHCNWKWWSPKEGCKNFSEADSVLWHRISGLLTD